MITIDVTNARKKLYQLIDSINDTHEPVIITGKLNSAVLISEKDWKSIEETLFLSSIHGMKESIINGLNESIENCSEELKW